MMVILGLNHGLGLFWQIAVKCYMKKNNGEEFRVLGVIIDELMKISGLVKATNGNLAYIAQE